MSEEFRRRAKAARVYSKLHNHLSKYHEDWIAAEERKIRKRQPIRAFFGLFRPMLKPPGWPERDDRKSQRVEDEARRRVTDRKILRRRALYDAAYPGTPKVRAEIEQQRTEEDRRRRSLFRR
ncbi:MAG: hypothetical protein AAF830_13965 [Pseudomonadota bacterium]